MDLHAQDKAASLQTPSPITYRLMQQLKENSLQLINQNLNAPQPTESKPKAELCCTIFACPGITICDVLRWPCTLLFDSAFKLLKKQTETPNKKT